MWLTCSGSVGFFQIAGILGVCSFLYQSIGLTVQPFCWKAALSPACPQQTSMKIGLVASRMTSFASLAVTRSDMVVWLW